MTLLTRLAGEIFDQPLLFDKGYLDVALTALHERLQIEPLVSDPAAIQAQHRPNRHVTINRDAGIAVVPIVGSMVHRGDMLNPSSGATSYTAIQSTLADLRANRDVRGIVIDMDTPGGQAAGVVETADFIKQLAAEKPVYVVANSMMTSGGMWLASAATRIYGAPMSLIGSIGVVTSHIDRSKALDKAGIAVTYVYAGEGKTDGNPDGPLTDAARAAIQERIDSVYATFVDTVARNRGLDPKAIRAIGAGVFSPEKALEIGLIDGIGGFADVIGAMSKRLAPTVQGVGFSATKDSNMTEKLLFGQADLDAAAAKAAADAKEAALSDLKAATTAAATEMMTAMAALVPGNARVSMFVEAINDGASVPLASKLAAKVAEPAPAAVTTARTADIEKVLAAAAPNVPSDDAGAPTGDAVADAKAARIAELKATAERANAIPFTA